MPLLRSLLVVPVLDAGAVAVAAATPADAIVLEMDTTVSAIDAPEARRRAVEAIAVLRADHRHVWVRVHPTETLLTKSDIRATLTEHLSGYLIPNARSANHLRYVDGLLRDAEAAAGVDDGKMRLIAMIESAEGVLNARESARASTRVVALGLDGSGYCADMGVTMTHEGHELQYARSHLAVCARAASVLALDTAYPFVREQQSLLANISQARAMGMHGTFVLTDGQAVAANAVFRPATEEIAYARRLQRAHDEARERGEDIAHVDGRVIDAPRALRARQLLELATAIEAKEQQAAI